MERLLNIVLAGFVMHTYVDIGQHTEGDAMRRPYLLNLSQVRPLQNPLRVDYSISVQISRGILIMRNPQWKGSRKGSCTRGHIIHPFHRIDAADANLTRLAIGCGCGSDSKIHPR